MLSKLKLKFTSGNNVPVGDARVTRKEYLDIEREVEVLIAQRDSAIDYIAASPCDPDIYPEQWDAWVIFTDLNKGWDD